jgi:hypothetical protein
MYDQVAKLQVASRSVTAQHDCACAMSVLHSCLICIVSMMRRDALVEDLFTDRAHPIVWRIIGRSLADHWRITGGSLADHWRLCSLMSRLSSVRCTSCNHDIHKSLASMIAPTLTPKILLRLLLPIPYCHTDNHTKSSIPGPTSALTRM